MFLIKSAANKPLTLLYKLHNLIAFSALISLGVILAFGLSSSAQDLTVALAGVSLYIVTIIIDPLKGLLLWLITQPVLESYLNISLGKGIPDLSLTRLSVGLVNLLLLTRSVIKVYRLQPLTIFDGLAFLLMVGIMQSAPGGKRGISTIQNVLDVYWIPILVYFAARNLVRNRQSLNLVLSAVALIGLYSAIYAIYESTTGNVLFASATHKKELVTVYVDSGLRILRGIWGSNVGFGRVINLSIPILFYFYLKTPSPTKKVLLTICLALAFGGLFVTYKRTAWLAMVGVMFVMQLFYPQFRRLFVGLLVVVGLALVLNWDSVSSSSVYTDRINSEHSTSEGRTEGWNSALEFWAVNPIFGRGYGRYAELARSAGLRDQAIESEYLNVLVSAGLLGFVPYVGLPILALYESIRHYRGQVPGSLADRDLIPVFWGILTGYVIGLSTSTVGTIELSIPSIFFALTGAILYSRDPIASVASGVELPEKQDTLVLTGQER